MNQRRSHGPENVPTSKVGVADAGLQWVDAGAGEPTYEQYYGLKARPFDLAVAPDALYRSPTHTSAVESLRGALRRCERLIVLTGEAGTGKTTVCRAALNGLGRETFTSVVPDPFLSREDLLRSLLVDFGHVSVDALARGHLSKASRLELCYQLRGFLAAVDAVDSSAVLVIDEAQHLASPLLDEIRALSELETGCTPLQIVLVGPPELRAHLAQPGMRQIEQRVTTRCELRPLTTEEVADYVAHRLTMAGGSRARIAFAQRAIDMIHAASNGVPRLVNVICDRAMSRGHLERTSVIGPPIVACALDDLQLTPVPAVDPVQPSAAASKAFEPTAPSRATASRSPRGLFEKKLVGDNAAFDFDALLALPTTSPRLEQGEEANSRNGGALSEFTKERGVAGDAKNRNGWGALKAAGLVVGGMIVMSIIGGFVVAAQHARPLTPLPTTSPAAASGVDLQVMPSASPPTLITAADRPVPPGTWSVQVAALESPERSRAMAQQLTELGFPVFTVEAETESRGLLSLVRVGPYETPADADDAGARLRQHAAFQGAFVLNASAP